MLRLWTWSEERETAVEPGLEHMGRRAWRKVLSVGFIGWDTFGVWHDTEMQYEKQAAPPGSWHECGRDYTHAWIGPWVWGETHDYYDGPHCGLHFGFLHFGWSHDWCLKCTPDESPRDEQATDQSQRDRDA